MIRWYAKTTCPTVDYTASDNPSAVVVDPPIIGYNHALPICLTSRVYQGSYTSDQHRSFRQHPLVSTTILMHISSQGARRTVWIFTQWVSGSTLRRRAEPSPHKLQKTPIRYQDTSSSQPSHQQTSRSDRNQFGRSSQQTIPSTSL